MISGDQFEYVVVEIAKVQTLVVVAPADAAFNGYAV